MRVDLAPARGIGTVPDGSVLILCSDGLHDVLDEGDLCAAFGSSSTVEEACHALVALAFDRGSRDNISIAATAVGGRLASGASLDLPRMAP
jgi:serine/threonine protein phosphatase PrpC